MRPRALRGAAAAAADRIISVLLRVALSSVACALTILAWRDKKSISAADDVHHALEDRCHKVWHRIDREVLHRCDRRHDDRHTITVNDVCDSSFERVR